MTSRTGSAWRILGFWKSQLVELRPASGEDGWLSLARGGFRQVPHEIGGRWKSQNRKNVYLSPYVEGPLNSKGNKKGSYLNWEVVTCFSNFEIPMFYVYMLWTSHVHFAYPYLAMEQRNPTIYPRLGRWNGSCVRKRNQSGVKSKQSTRVHVSSHLV